MACALTFTLLGGCGGRVRTDDPAPRPGPPSGAEAERTGSEADDDPGSVELPECQLGEDPDTNSLRPCSFVVAGRCYEKKIDACACACAAMSGTLCLSGFAMADGRAAVSCH